MNWTCGLCMQVGKKVDEITKKYETVKKIGRGSFGEVTLVRCRETMNLFACKTISSKPPGERARMRREIEMIRQLNETPHSNLVTMHEIIEHEKQRGEKLKVHIIMEHMDSGNLHDKVKHHTKLTVMQARRYFSQLLNALQFMHDQEIAHCDVKADNLLIAPGGGLKLCDFGLSRRTKDAYGRYVRCSHRIGTASSMAPEVYNYRCDNLPAADVWSAGVVLVFMLIGSYPWQKPNCGDKAYKDWKSTGEKPWQIITSRRAIHVADILLVREAIGRPRISDIRMHPFFTGIQRPIN